MTYDWQKTLQIEMGTREYFEEVDRRLFSRSCQFWTPAYPDELPFNRQINYAVRRGQRVSEIGCGLGSTAAVMVREGLDVCALDLSPSAVSLSQRRFNLYDLPGNIMLSEGERLPFDSASLDFVWSWGVIHHSADMQEIVQEICWVLKPGGDVKVMVYHRHALRNWITAGLLQGLLKLQFLL